MSKLIIISAPSGAGKTTLVKHLLSTINSLSFSVSCATRPMREGEVDGKDYYFISTDEFKQKIEQNEFIEWEEVYKGSFYGTLRSEITRIWALGHNVIFDIDVLGGINLKSQFPDALSIFIAPPSMEELEARLIKRNTENDDTLRTRVDKAKEEMKLAEQFDVIVINNQLEEAKKEITTIVEKFIKK